MGDRTAMSWTRSMPDTSEEIVPDPEPQKRSSNRRGGQKKSVVRPVGGIRYLDSITDRAMDWFLLAHAGATTGIHHDGFGAGTWIHVQCGYKYWAWALPRLGETRAGALGETTFLATNLDGTFGSVRRYYGVLLGPGDLLCVLNQGVWLPNDCTVYSHQITFTPFIRARRASVQGGISLLDRHCICLS